MIHVVNHFANINAGTGIGGFHTDTPTRGRVGAKNSGRLLVYVCTTGKRAGLAFRRGAAETLLHVPPGCAVYATNKILTGCSGVEHSHHALGQSFSHVFEVAYLTIPDAATPEMVAKTTVLQVAENINIDELLGVFNPTDFKAQPGRLIGAASGSQEFCAMFLLRGPKLGSGWPRLMSRLEARELIAAMSPTELAACASTAGRRVATTCALQREFSVSLIEARLLATEHTIETFAALTPEERKRECATRHAEAYSAARVRLQALIRVGSDKAFAACPEAQSRLASGESSCKHGAIISMSSDKAFAACPEAQARLASGESSCKHGAIISVGRRESYPMSDWAKVFFGTAQDLAAAAQEPRLVLPPIAQPLPPRQEGQVPQRPRLAQHLPPPVEPGPQRLAPRLAQPRPLLEEPGPQRLAPRLAQPRPLPVEPGPQGTYKNPAREQGSRLRLAKVPKLHSAVTLRSWARR